MKKSTVVAWLAIGILSASSAAQAVTYDAGLDFQTLSNPAGPWSYGYSPGSTTYSMTLFDTTASGNIGSSTYASWTKAGYISLGTPVIWKNTGASTAYGVAPGQLALHPGPVANGDQAVLRFTAPTAGRYDYTGIFGAGDSGGTSGSLAFNGDLLNPLISFASTANSPTFSGFVNMLMGQTLDVVVGNNGSYFSDTTPVSFRLESTVVAAPVPEPETYAMMLAGLGLLGVMTRRRKQKAVA
jgi:hypothetical protein